MKMTTLIMIVFLIQVSAATKAQVTLNAKNEPIRNVLKSISKQSGYDFIYTDQDLEKARPVSIELNNVSIDKALQLCFEGQPLIYEISDKTVMVRKKEEKSVIDRVKDFFAGKEIRGRVVDENGNSMVGANVLVKKTNQSTVTNQFGTFTLKNVPEDAMIVISYIGYKPFEIGAQLFGPKQTLIALERGESKLDEVQVQAYGLTTRRLSTGDISTVKAADIEKQDVNNPLLALQGRVAGLTVTPASGLPGAPITIQIRGVNTLGNLSGFGTTPKTALPLILVDGVPYANNISMGRAPGAAALGNSALSFINPADIESIDVLKDADATAIYGSRGANGVILITTKKGKIGSSDINVGASSGYAVVPKMLDLLNTQQYLAMRKEAYKNDGLPVPSTPSSSNYDLTVWDQNRYTDWQKQLIGGTAKYMNAQASVSGGSPTVQYLISGLFNRQGYVFPGDAKNEFGDGHFSISGNSLNNKFKATLTGSYSASKAVSAIDFTGRALGLAPNAPNPYKSDGSFNWEPNPNTGFGTWLNPYSLLLKSHTSQTTSFNSSADLSYQLLPSLTIKASVGFNSLRGKVFSPAPLSSVDPATLAFGITGTSSFDASSSGSWSVEPQVLYHNYIGQGRLDLIGGASMQSEDHDFQEITALGFTSDALLGDLGSATNYIGSNTSSQYKYTGFFARASYNWADKYLINLNARRDGSSRFGPRDQFGNFGSVGAAWIFSQEGLVRKTLPFMSFGKLRFSYGTSGNDGIGNYQYLELYQNIDDNPTYQGGHGIVSQGVTNPYYHWETTHKTEIGLETGFFKDRIIFTTSYFRNRSSDQLGVFSLPSTAGNGSNFVVNQPAKIENSGWEFTLNTRNVTGTNFTWTTAFNLSFQRNKLLALPVDGEVAYGLHPATKIGDPYVGVAYVNIFRGVDPATGRYQFTDNTGALVSSGDLAATLVSTTPKFYGGLMNSFSYKGFSLDIFLQFTKQTAINYLFDSSGPFFTPGNFSGTSNTGNMPVEILGRWQNPGDVTNIQRVTSKNSGDIKNSLDLARNSTAAYVDASFIKLKNVSFSYSFLQKWKDKLGVKSLRLYVQGQNLWTITGYKGLDPETQSTLRLPQLRVLTAGIQAGF